MKYKCIIFDCDGVLVDSEVISSKIFMEMAEELGFKMDIDFATEKFSGSSMKENLKFIEDNIKGDLPSNFEKKFRKQTFEAFKTDIKPIEGIKDLLDKINIPICVASSGPMEKIKLNLTTTKLIDRFGKSIFSSYDIGSWKPEPGIFLYAAKEMGYKPSECVVIEDSVAGIRAARVGGFEVFGYAKDTNKSAFEALGANIFFNMNELSSLLNLG
ncbi:MAG: HAD family hydrolase [Bacteroidales bacterium]|nr:HAD family hydrolase [Bacteroidales bacterium]